MNVSQNPLEQLGAIFRDIVRDAVRTELQAAPPPPISLPTNRLGGIKLFCEVTGMAEQTGYNLASRREVPFAKRGGKLIFSESELRLWMMENRRPMQREMVANAHQFITSPRRKGGTK